MSASKLDTMCADLDFARTGAFHNGAENAGLNIAKAIALLRAYDDLGEFVAHWDGCDQGDMGKILDCTCGLEVAQKKVAAILEGQG